jgi:excinuclease UvrABC ATPase subunit
VSGLNELLKKLRDRGNTVLVVEHDRDVIEIADHVVDIGPGAGENGGEIVYKGTVEGLYEADTVTGRFMSHRMAMKAAFRQPTGQMAVRDATRHNLKHVTVEIPTASLRW